MATDSQTITTLLVDWRNGNTASGDQLATLLYNELRVLAIHYLRQERPGHTLEPEALVHELYLRLFGASEPVACQNRAHFFAVAAQTLRRILVDHARAHSAEKRGGEHVRVSLTSAEGWAESQDEDLLAVEEALQQLRLNVRLPVATSILDLSSERTSESSAECDDLRLVESLREGIRTRL